MKRSVYLSLTPLPEARERVLSSIPSLDLPGHELVATVEAGGRIAAEGVFARRSIPHYAAAAMDGVAVNASVTFGATDATPVTLKIGETAFWINTGAPMPPGTNAVIMVEHLLEAGPDTFEIRSAAHPWQHVRPVGEDIIKGDLLLVSGQPITPPDVAALLNAGVFSLKVKPRPRIAILPTGSELVSPEKDPEPGQVIESNSRMIAGYVWEDGGSPTILPPCKDEREELIQALKQAIEVYDILFILSGSSAGAKDFTRTILEELGEVLIHGIAMMPGKPALFGVVGKKPVFGIPGYPTSAALYYEEVIRPFLGKLTSRIPHPPATIQANLVRKVPSKLGQEEFIRVRLGKVGETWIAVPLARGAGILKSLCEADGILRIPLESEGATDTAPVTIYLRRDRSVLEGQLIFIGSHDLSLDRINVLMAEDSSGVSLAIGAVGSLGGLFTLKDGKTHLTAVHLLDPETETYNLPYIKKYLPGRKVRIIHLLKRTQGLMVKKGNPKGITTIKDLAREDVQFVNRQRGAGTRVLLDFFLEREGLSPDMISGYANEVATHAMVAAEIQGGMADCGLGIQAAAHALELDFIPLAEEPYDLVIPEEFFGDWRIRILLDIIRSNPFREAMKSMGGYDPSESGTEKTL
ncbi:MAG: molybdopterin biosynthesis protein [Deltaproteobacteria bacterium]|nr:molybdopterin biosynthesis protein [Deltaproteobacteria bacterium]